MSILEEQVECPLCMEPLEMDDSNFFPCTCGYQICRFCWHRIRTDENGLCPACRKAYPEDPAEFKPLTDDELQRIKKERKLKDLQRRQRAAENRKHLANVRVVQKNLVFAVGLSQRLGDVEMLKKHDYFGKFGKIVKVVINQTTSYAGAQGPSASAYITYQRPEDALRAIQAVNNIHVDGRTLKASLGTTKYCSHFLKGTQCPKPDCMYLHELGEETASFTKEEMQQGKHTEYEQKLYETYMNHLNSVANITATTSSSTSTENKPAQTAKTRLKTSSSSSAGNSKTISPPLPSQHTADAWPSLNHNSHDTDRGSSSDRSKQPASTSSTPGAVGSSKLPPCSASNSPPPPTTSAPTQSHSSVHITPHSNSTQQANQHKPPSLLDMALQRPSAHSVAVAVPGSSSSVQQPHNGTQSQQTHRHQPTGKHKHATSLSSDSAMPSLLPVSANRLTHSQPTLGSHGAGASSFFSDTSDNNLSLFGLSGFSRKPPPPGGLAVLNNSNTVNTLVNGNATSQSQQSMGGSRLGVTSSAATDWSAAFGFNANAALAASSASAAATTVKESESKQQTSPAAAAPATSAVHTDSADDDLGFDPFRESTKALQDLMEKESSSSSAAQSPNTHYPMTSGTQSFSHLHTQHAPTSNGGLHDHKLPQPSQARPLPPGFAPNLISNSFNSHFPHISGSRMMQLLNLTPSHGAPPPLSTSPLAATDMSHAAFNGTAGLGNGFPMHHHLHTAPPPPPGVGMQAQGEGEALNMKDLEENLRQMLPNCNIHIGSSVTAGHRQQVLRQQQNNTQQQQPQKQPQSTNWDPSWDPAVVTTGNVSQHNQPPMMNGGEEPHWMVSLRALTEEPPTSVHAHHALPPTAAHKLLNFGGSAARGHSTMPPAGFMAQAGVVGAADVTTPPPPPPGFQLPVRGAAHPLADSFQ